jgi:ADP-heptose:LPS heptosyltransferase
VIDLSPHTADMFETAAAVAELDLVIMTDTAVAHLAGALGKEVWVLLCRVPHWMWQYERADCPWYPTMRLFRQRAWGDWTTPFDEAGAALLQRVIDRTQSR